MKSEFWIENKHKLWYLMPLVSFLLLCVGVVFFKTSKNFMFFIFLGFVSTMVTMCVAFYLADRLRNIVCVCGAIARYSGTDMDISMYSCEKCGYSISEYGKNYNWHSLPSYHPRINIRKSRSK